LQDKKNKKIQMMEVIEKKLRLLYWNKKDKKKKVYFLMVL